MSEVRVMLFERELIGAKDVFFQRQKRDPLWYCGIALEGISFVHLLCTVYVQAPSQTSSCVTVNHSGTTVISRPDHGSLGPGFPCFWRAEFRSRGIGTGYCPMTVFTVYWLSGSARAPH